MDGRLSASRLVQDTGLNLIMKQDGTCVLKQENQIIELRSQEGGIYSLVSKAEIWHARLGHASVHTLRQLGLPSEMKVCEACVKSKLFRRPHKSVERDMKPLDRISIDIMGPKQAWKHGFNPKELCWKPQQGMNQNKMDKLRG